MTTQATRLYFATLEGDLELLEKSLDRLDQRINILLDDELEPHYLIKSPLATAQYIVELIKTDLSEWKKEEL